MSDTAPREPYGRRPLPARSDWRRALGVYVSGRSRALTLDEKWRLGGLREAGDDDGDESRASRVGATRRVEVVYGVTVPRVFDFYRNASTWRNDLPEPKPRGETTSRA